MELMIISIVGGLVLGLRYKKIQFVVAAIMLAMMFAVLVGIARADGVWSVVLMTIALGIAVQMGYLAGIAIRAVVEWMWALLTRGRNLQLSSLEPLWLHPWQLNGGQAPRTVTGAVANLRRPPHSPV
jgi:hypothetical protein